MNTDERLVKLKQRYESGLITEEVYGQWQLKILEEEDRGNDFVTWMLVT